jgi:thioredoxin-like negative regulator of GroEL
LDSHFLKILFVNSASFLAVANDWGNHGRLVFSDSDASAKLVSAQLPAAAQNPVASSTDRPFLVFIHSKQCNVCAKVQPILQQLEKTYNGKVQFIYLDVTDEHAKESARKIAKSMGLGAFFAFYEDTYPCVGVFDAKKKCIKELYGAQSEDKYCSNLDKAISAN